MAEPNTSGKIVLCTTQGDLDIEFWANEVGNTCRHFLQNCVDGMYKDSEFTIAEGQVGLTPKVPLDVGFQFMKIDTHTRLRFLRRGMVAVCLDDDNASVGNIIITTSPASWLDQKKFIIIGTVVGNTVYNQHNISTTEHENGQPINPIVVNDVKILKNPFFDMKPSKNLKQSVLDVVSPVVPLKKAVKNAALLSFDDGEDEFVDFLRVKRKSEKQKKEQERLLREQEDTRKKQEEQLVEEQKTQQKSLLLEKLDMLIEKDVQEKQLKRTSTGGGNQDMYASVNRNVEVKSNVGVEKKGKFQKRKDKVASVDETEALKKQAEFKNKLISSRQAESVVDKESDESLATYLNIEQFSKEEESNWMGHRFETVQRPQDIEIELNQRDRDTSDSRRDRDYRK